MDELPDVGMGRLSDRERTAHTAAGDSERRGRPAGSSRPRRRASGQPEPGTSLDEAVRSSGPLSVEEVQTLGARLASLLTRLHAAGEVHGDIRPATVFLTSKGARLGEGDPFRQAAIVSDSVYFVAPELLDDPGASSSATDVFALGSVLAFAATGVSPFGARSVTQPADGSAMPDLSAVPEALRRVVERCLDANGAARPTAITLSILFAARLEDVPVPVLPVPKLLGVSAAGSAEVAEAVVRLPETEATALLQKPLFYFVRDRMRGRTAAVVGALALVAVVAGVASLGVDGSDEPSNSARGAANRIADGSGTTTAGATTPGSSPVSSSPVSSSSSAPSAPSSSTVTTHPAPAQTTSKPPAPRVTQAPSPAGGQGQVAYMGHAKSAPAAPGNPRIVSGYVMTADVSWASVPGATDYEVSYSGSVSGGGTVTTSGTSTTLKGLFPSEQLCAKVRSVNQYGASAWVSTASCIMVI